MKSQTVKRVTDSQPAVLMATALAAICLHQRWPMVALVFIVLQMGILAAVLRPRAQRARALRFLARANAIPTDSAQLLPRRPQLHLVP